MTLFLICFVLWLESILASGTSQSSALVSDSAKLMLSLMKVTLYNKKLVQTGADFDFFGNLKY